MSMAVLVIHRERLSAGVLEGHIRNMTSELTVRRPNETVPTNLRTDTFLDAIVSMKIEDRRLITDE